MKTILSFVFLFCSLVSAAESAFHIKVPRQNGNTAHGTCFVFDGYVVTCAHTMGNDKSALVFANGEWTAAALVKIDVALDVAWLKPVKPIVAAIIPPGFVVAAGNRNETVTKIIPIISVLKYECVIADRDHGVSGSPVYRDGKLLGMVYSITGDKDGNKTDKVNVVSIEAIEKTKP